MEYLIIFLVGVVVGIVVDKKHSDKIQRTLDFFNKWKS